MAFTRVVFEVENCAGLDEAVNRIRKGDEEPVDFSVEDDDAPDYIDELQSRGDIARGGDR